MLFAGLFLPLLGTALGAAAVLFFRSGIPPALHRCCAGFAAGVMTAAAIWSLLLPALAAASVLSACCGLWSGAGFLILLERLVPSPPSRSSCGDAARMTRTSLLCFAVTLHNLPEGMAVGATLAGAVRDPSARAAALALAVGIAVQNIPEGAILSMPLHSGGMRKGPAFWCGTLSGGIEPIGAGLTLLLSGCLIPALPWLLAFAAGAMLWVVAEDLIPVMVTPDHRGTLWFFAGFTLMLLLDVLLG